MDINVIEFVRGTSTTKPKNMVKGRYYLWFDEENDEYVLSSTEENRTFYSWDEVSQFIHDEVWC